MLKKIVLFMGVLWAMNVHASGFVQNFDVSIGIFDAAKITLNYEETPEHFDIKAIVQTANIFNTLYPFYGEYQSYGRVLENGKIRPERYVTSNKTRGHKRHKEVFYNDKGRAYQSVSSKDNKERTRVIDDTVKTASAADLQTVFADLIINFKKSQSCAITREVYDGKKHYKVIAKDVGVESLENNKSEKAYRCLLYIENLKDNNDNILWDVSADKPINIRIGYNKTLKMPYLLEIKIDSTPLGELKVLPTTLEFK